MQPETVSTKNVAPEKIKKDNSDIRRYSDKIWRELRKERFNKFDPETYLAYCEVAGITGSFSTEDYLIAKMDMNKFSATLSEEDVVILGLMLKGCTQAEIGRLMGTCQSNARNRVNKIKAKLKAFFA